MSKGQPQFTPEQTRAIEQAPAELTIGAIVGMAQAGELGVKPFHPSKATVQRIRLEARETGRIGPEPEPTVADHYLAAEALAYEFLAEIAEEIKAHKVEKGEHNTAKVKNYCQAVKMMGANLGRKDVRKPEPSDTPTPETPRSSGLLARLANGAAASNEHNDTESGEDALPLALGAST